MAKGLRAQQESGTLIPMGRKSFIVRRLLASIMAKTQSQSSTTIMAKTLTQSQSNDDGEGEWEYGMFEI